MEYYSLPISSRKLLQFPQARTDLPNSPPAGAGDPTSSGGVFDPQFDSSMALTILVLLTALFFMAFFSLYIRRFAATDETPPPPSSAAPNQPPPPKGGGLDPSVMKTLPLVAYGKAAKHRMSDDCPVCLGEFQERESVKLIPFCGHVFHSHCIDTWLSAHVTCPLCRSSQLFRTQGNLSPSEV